MTLLSHFWKKLTVKSVQSLLSIIFWASWHKSQLPIEHSHLLFFIVVIIVCGVFLFFLCRYAIKFPYHVSPATAPNTFSVYYCKSEWSTRFLCSPEEISAYRTLWRSCKKIKGFKKDKKRVSRDSNVKGTNSHSASFWEQSPLLDQ